MAKRKSSKPRQGAARKNQGPNMPVDVQVLDDLQFWETGDPSVCAMLALNAKKQTVPVAMDSGNLAAVVGRLLDQACHPDFKAASLAKHGFRSCHIGGSQLELKSGRSDKEVAVTLTIGCIQMVVFLPLEEVLRASGELIRNIEPDSGLPRTH